jgi:hypothetical protein
MRGDTLERDTNYSPGWPDGRERRDGGVNDPFAGLPLLIPVPQAAKLIGISRAAAYRYAASGELPVKRLGGRVYIITAKIRPLIDGTEGNAA